MFFTLPFDQVHIGVFQRRFHRLREIRELLCHDTAAHAMGRVDSRRYLVIRSLSFSLSPGCFWKTPDMALRGFDKLFRRSGKEKSALDS